MHHFTKFFLFVLLFNFSFIFSQNLTITNTGETGSSGTNWNISSNTLTITGNANIRASVIENHLTTTGPLTLRGTGSFAVTVSEAITVVSGGNALVFGSEGNTGNFTSNAVISTNGTVSVYGGIVLVNQNLTSTLNGAAVLLQATSYIGVAASRTIQTTNGNITLRSNAGGTAVVLPNTSTGAITLNNGSSLLSNGGNITLGGNFDGTEGIGLYAASNLSGGAPAVLIDNATLTAAGGNINIYGKCASSYDDGIRLQAVITTTGSGTVGLYGDAHGGYNGTQFFGGITFFNAASRIETENGNVTLKGVLTAVQSNNTFGINFYRQTGGAVQTNHIQILSQTGDIQVTGDRGSTSAGGIGSSSWGNIYFGSPANNAYTAQGDITLTYSSFVGAVSNGFKVKTTGAVTYEPTATSFVNAQTFPYNSNYTVAEGASSLKLGKDGNTANITIGGDVSIAGPIVIMGGYINLNGNLTSSAAGDIFIKGIAGTNPSVEVQSGKIITKSGGTGTLTLQGHGRVLHQGSITTSGTGVLNVIFWSDFDNDNDDGGVSQLGTISTNGGHVWLGGSNSNGGSYTWKGLTVGDGPSIGASGFNGNAMDIFANITTNGGDFLAWAGSTTSGGIAGIGNDGSGDIVSVGSGNIVLITDMIYGSSGAAMYFTQSGGTFTLVPHDGSFRSAFNWNPAIQTYIGSTADDYNIQAGDFDWLGIGDLNSISRLTIGYYNGMLNNGIPVEFTNSSNITFSTATTAAGAFELYGGAIALNTNLTTTSSTNGNIVLSGTTLSGSANLAVATGRTATINVSSTSTYDGIISGNGSGLTKLGAGMLTLTKDHTYSGATTISAGNLQVGTGGSVSQASSGTINSTSGVSIATGSKLILTPNENVTFAAPISGGGGVEIKGASGAYYNTFLTGTAQTIATNTSVLEVLTRITGGMQQGNAITGSQVAGTYHKSYNAATNTATFQFQQFDGQFTKCVFVALSKSGGNVQIRGNTSIYSGAAYRSGNHLGADMSTGSTLMGLATCASCSGYGISNVYMSGKVNFTGALTYTGNTTLSNTVTSVTSPNTYTYTSKGTIELTDASSSFPATSTVVNNGLVILNRTTPLTITSNFQGSEEVLQVGAEITLTGTNTNTGITTIDLNKSLIIGDGATLGSMTGNIINYGSLTYNRSDTSTYPGNISGTGTLTKLGEGNLTLTGLNTYSGATTITAGKLILENNVPSTNSSNFSGTGHLVIQPSGTSFTNALNFPIPGFNIASTIGGLTLGKPSNNKDITFSSATSIAGPIAIYGGIINLNTNLISSASNAAIIIKGNQVIHSPGVLVQSNNGDISYEVTNAQWSANSDDQGIRIGEIGSLTSTINAQGGDISLTASFAPSGTTNSGAFADVAIRTREAIIKTSGTGQINIDGNGYDNGSTDGDFIWGVLLFDTVVQTEDGALSIKGTGGKNLSNSRGIIADPAELLVLSKSGTITFTDVMPNGHSGSNHTGLYLRPSAANAIKIGADGTNVVSSTSNIVFDVERISFDILPTVVSTAGTVTIKPVAETFATSVSNQNLNISNSCTGFIVGKPTNSTNITFANTTQVAGPINAYGGTVTLNANLITTNGGDISFYTDNALGGLTTPRILTASGAFKYIPRGTTFSADVTYPIANLTATSTGLTIGNSTNDKNITINTDVIGGAGIQLFGNTIAINSNLRTTNGAAMYLKGNTTIASTKYIESSGDFTHDGNLIFKSDAVGTAAFGTLGGTFTSVSGSATIERYIPARRAWRLLTAPLKGTSNTTVPNNWQGVNDEGLLLFSPSTYQSQTMTGYTTGGGSPNIWKYDSANTQWQSIPNLTTENLFTSTGNNGFLVFATGPSNSANIVTGEAVTTLRPQGQLITGAVSHSLTADKYHLIGNPYASAIDTEAMVQANSGTKVFMVDPSLGTVGGYFTYDGSNWAPTEPALNDKNIQSGQGFFVRSASNPTFTISEVHKVVGTSNAWFDRVGSNSSSSSSDEADKIRVLLYKQLNSQWQLADGILTVNSVGGNDGVDAIDTGKMTNFNENIAFRNGTSNLAIEYRGLPTTGTVQQMRLTGTTVQPYQLQVKTENYSNSGLQPYLEDTQAGTLTLIPTDGSDVVVNFTGMAATAAAPDARFRIVYPSALGVDAPDALAVGVYPNPTEEGVFAILLPLAGETARYTLTNLVGQEVQQGTLDSVSSRVSVSSLQGGVYLLEVNQSGKRFTTKLIIK